VPKCRAVPAKGVLRAAGNDPTLPLPLLYALVSYMTILYLLLSPPTSNTSSPISFSAIDLATYFTEKTEIAKVLTG